MRWRQGLEAAATGSRVPDSFARSSRTLGRAAPSRTRPSALPSGAVINRLRAVNDLVNTGRFESPTSGVSCRRSASELCVRVVIGSCSIDLTRASPNCPLSPWSRPRDSNPNRLGYEASAHPVGPDRHIPCAFCHAASSGNSESSAWSMPRSLRTAESGDAGTTWSSSELSVAVSAPSSGRTRLSRSCRMEAPPFRWFGRKVSNPHLKDQNLASCHWTTPERIVVGEADGSAPVLVTGSHACLCEELCSNSRLSDQSRGFGSLDHSPDCCGVRSPLVWLNGFEPLTSRSRTRRSAQTELQPGVATGRTRSSVSRWSRTHDGMVEESIALPTEREAPGAGRRRASSCAQPWVPAGRIERPLTRCRAVYCRVPLTNRGHRGGTGRPRQWTRPRSPIWRTI